MVHKLSDVDEAIAGGVERVESRAQRLVGVLTLLLACADEGAELTKVHKPVLVAIDLAETHWRGHWRGRLS